MDIANPRAVHCQKVGAVGTYPQRVSSVPPPPHSPGGMWGGGGGGADEVRGGGSGVGGRVGGGGGVQIPVVSGVSQSLSSSAGPLMAGPQRRMWIIGNGNFPRCYVFFEIITLNLSNVAC